MNFCSVGNVSIQAAIRENLVKGTRTLLATDIHTAAATTTSTVIAITGPSTDASGIPLEDAAIRIQRVQRGCRERNLIGAKCMAFDAASSSAVNIQAMHRRAHVLSGIEAKCFEFDTATASVVKIQCLQRGRRVVDEYSLYRLEKAAQLKAEADLARTQEQATADEAVHALAEVEAAEAAEAAQAAEAAATAKSSCHRSCSRAISIAVRRCVSND